jgi:hypothetical protein
MMKTVMIAALLAVATLGAGCQTLEERRAAEAAADAADCRSFGARPGTPEYVRCRTELRRVRAEAERPVVVQTIRPAPVFGPFGPSFCRRTVFGVECF